MKIGKFLQLLICTLNVPVTKSYLKRRETDILKYPTSNVFSGLHLTWEFWITPNKRRIQIGATRWLWNLTTILQDFLIKKSNTSMTKFWLEIREIKWGVLKMPIYLKVTPEGEQLLVKVVKGGQYWHYRLSSFQAGCVRLGRFLPKNQHTQRKFLNFEDWTNG